MILARLLSLAAMCLTATVTHAAGFALIDVPADKDGPALHGAVEILHPWHRVSMHRGNR